MMTATSRPIGRRRFLQVSAAGLALGVPAALAGATYWSSLGIAPPQEPAFAALPAEAADTGPAPILVLLNHSSAHPFATYLPELLRAEGIVATATRPLDADLKTDDLAPFSLVILSPGALSPAQREPLLAYVRAGGALLALRPDADLAGAGGLDQVATKIDQGYCVADVTRAAGWMPAPTQVHGAGDHYRVQEAETLAWMGATLEETIWPAVTLRRLGAGSI
ncbi:MAG: hypothetical protein ACRC1H_08880, partial [Caldilineaceae bacterium]